MPRSPANKVGGAPFVCFALLACLAGAARAHPGIGYNLRAAHFEHRADGVTVYFRLTLPLVVGNRLGRQRADGTFEPAPYTYNKLESGRVFHYLDVAAVRKGASDLGRYIATGHELVVQGKIISPQLLSVRLHPKGKVPPFSTLAEAKAAASGPVYPDGREEIDTGYVLVDAVMFYPQKAGVGAFSLRSTLMPGELGEPLTRNIFWDHRGEKIVSYDVRGLLEEPLLIDPAHPPPPPE